MTKIIQDGEAVTEESQRRLFIQSVKFNWLCPDLSWYIRGIQAISGTERIDFFRPVTVFVGENGSGKSTLLEAMASSCGFNPEGGTRNYSFSTYAGHNTLARAIRVVKGYRSPRWGYYYRADSFYNVATMEEEYSKSGGPPSQLYHHESHGESFMHLLSHDMKADSLYFLDEPEAGLSVQNQLAAVREITLNARRGSQFFIVTHSAVLQGIPDADIISFDGPVRRIGYAETSSYTLTRLFMRDREGVLGHLLADPG